MSCTICGKPIVLVPSAAERAAKDVTGRPASYYTGLFRQHSDCFLEQRAHDTTALMRRLNKEKS
jgi:hypothetical protein